jgi:transcriptional regulator with XRE-family HTH domain
MYNLNFEELQRRMVTYLRNAVRNGDMTERRLARISGVSQPHIHHVLQGKRQFSPMTADQVLRALGNDLLDFVEPEDFEEWKRRE